MNSPYLSIIIPTFNVEKYIVATLNSIVSQSFSDYEIIVVDDASTDNTVGLCMSYKESHPSVNIIICKLFHGGVSNARNYGISKAKGKYIHFIDSDDEIMPDMYETYYGLSIQMEYDLIIGSVQVIKPSNKTVLTTNSDINCTNKAKIVKWLRELSVGEKDWMLNVVWNKWFKREIIEAKSIQYKNICPGEDYEFVMRYLGCCESVYVSTKPIYKYYQRGNISLLNRKYSHESQLERRVINWETTQNTLATIGVFNPAFLIAEGYSLYSTIYADMHGNCDKKKALKDYFSLNQYDCVSLYFETRNTIGSKIVSMIFSIKNVYLIRLFFLIKSLVEK